MRFGASDRANVVFHFFHGDEGRVRIAENNHPKRVANENEWDAGFIEEAGSGIVVGRKRRDAFAALFHSAKHWGGDFERAHHKVSAGGLWIETRVRVLEFGRALPLTPALSPGERETGSQPQRFCDPSF